MEKAKFAIFKINSEYSDKVTAAAVKKAIKCDAVYEVTDSFSIKQKDKNISTLNVYDILDFRNLLRRVIGPGCFQLFMFSEDALSSMLGIKFTGRLYSICTITPTAIESLTPCIDRLMDVTPLLNGFNIAEYNSTEFIKTMGPGLHGYGDWTGKLDDKQIDFFTQLPQRIKSLRAEIDGQLLSVHQDAMDILNNGWD